MQTAGFAVFSQIAAAASPFNARISPRAEDVVGISPGELSPAILQDMSYSYSHSAVDSAHWSCDGQ
jgi:hypothetical protein